MQHIILRFISQKDWAEQFVSGRLYMNSLYYFWNEFPNNYYDDEKDQQGMISDLISEEKYDLSAERKASPGRNDCFEGTIKIAEDKEISADFGDFEVLGTFFRAIGYGYCNTLSFYRLDYEKAQRMHEYDIPKMSGFGDYVVIIKNEPEFIRRVDKHFRNTEYNYIYGDIHYQSIGKREQNTEIKHNLVLKAEDKVRINETDIKSFKDCFFKMEGYSNQMERRLAVYRGIKETNAYIAEIGSLEDIAVLVHKNKLVGKLDELLRNDEIMPSIEGYSGNIIRKEMKKKFFELGDGMVERLVVVG